MSLPFDIKVILAPLAEITDIPFRHMVRKFSSCLMFSEMISAAGASQNNQKTLDMMCLKEEEQPIGIQLFGHSPELLAKAGLLAEEAGAKLIDINMGCPVRKIVNDGNGSALMKDEVLAGKIVEALVKAVKIPVSVKFRTGWSKENINAPSFAKVLENSGASMLTVHGRTRADFYSGEADWEIIKKVKESVLIPVIGNGDIKTPTDALKRIEETGVDGVMIGRASLGHPYLLGQIEALLKGKEVPKNPSVLEQKELLLEHFSLMLHHYGDKKGMYMFRKHICWYVTGLKGASKFRQKVNSIDDTKELTKEIEIFYEERANEAIKEKSSKTPS